MKTLLMLLDDDLRSRGRRCVMTALLLAPLGCPNETLDGMNSSEAGASTDGATGSSAEDETSTDDGGSMFDPCGPWCERRLECGEREMGACLAECRAMWRWRTENFDEACAAATQERMTCVMTAACDAGWEECEVVMFAEYEACVAGVMPQPGLAEYCMLVRSCGLGPYELCVRDLLDFQLYDTYLEGCESEYDALLGCAGAHDCDVLQDEALLESACASESAAVSASCESFG
jgi:hypothetical protein